MTDKLLFKKVGTASFIMILSVAASRVIGLAREMSIAFVGGAQGCVDAYQVSFILPEILNHIVASGFLSVTFIPIFSDYLARDDEAGGWQVFSNIFITFGGLLIFFIAVSMVFAPRLVHLLAPGMDDPELVRQAVKMTRIILPAQFFFFAGGLFMAVQFAKETFFIPALAPLIYNTGIIAGGLLLSPWIGMEGFAWGVLGGAFFGNFLLQWLKVRKQNFRLTFLIDLTHPDFIKYILLTLPLMVGLTMTFSTEIFLKFFGSFLEEGSIAALNYSLRLMFILVGIFGQAVGVASYPFMAKLASENNFQKMNDILNRTLRFLFLVIPFSVLFIMLRYEIVLLVFKRGSFDLAATRFTSRVLPFLMAGAVAFCAQTIVVRGYYAVKNTWFPALFSTITVAASLPLFFIFMEMIGARGVGLALSLSATIQVFVLFELWNLKSGNTGKKSVYTAFVKMTGLAVALGVLLWPAVELLQRHLDNTSFHGAFLISAATGILFMLILLGGGYLFRIEEVSVFAGTVSEKIHKTLLKR